MLGINSNINSLVAQQNLSSSGSALSQAITRLSSGKRINSAADDAAGLAISNIMQTQINGLNQGVSNANDGVSMVQTASSGLSSLTNSLQRIRQLAVQASDGSMTDSDRAALQQEVSQQIQEVNRIASQTTYNGMNILNGSLGSVSFQVGANVGQSISLNLSQNMSAANLGGGVVQKGSVVGTLSGLSLNSDGTAYTGSGSAALSTINVLADGNGGFTFTDQNNQALSTAAVNNLFGGQAANTGSGTPLTLTAQGALTNGASATQTSAIAAIQSANAQLTSGGFAVAGTTLSSIALPANLNADLSGGTSTTSITSIEIDADGAGGYTYKALNGSTDVTSKVTNGSLTGSQALASLFTSTTGSGTTPGTLALSSTGSGLITGTDLTNANAAISSAQTANYIAPTYPHGIQASGATVGTITLSTSLDPTGAAVGATGYTGNNISSIEVDADGSGGFTYKAFDSSGNDITSAISGDGGDLSGIFSTATTPTGADTLSLSIAGNTAIGSQASVTSGLAAVNAANQPTLLGTVAVNLDANGNAVNSGTNTQFTSVNVYADGSGGYTFQAVDKSGAVNSSATTAGAAINANAAKLFTVGSATSTGADALSGAGILQNNPNVAAATAAINSANADNAPGQVSEVNIGTSAGASLAIETIDNALDTVNNLQASLGAAQNRFTAISTTQQAQSTNLSNAQSQIQDADFAQETANLSKAQVLQQAGISVLAQANSQPQQILKLLQ